MMKEPHTRHDADKNDGITVRFLRSTLFGARGEEKKLSASTALGVGCAWQS